MQQLSENKPRPSFAEIYMRMALTLAERSTCDRLQVGCVITTTDHRQVLAVGYNGSAEGLANGCESTEPGQCGHLHAEENAVISCTAARDVPKVVYTTHLPCAMCAKRLINLGGVKRVIYFEDYRVRTALDILGTAGIRTRSYVEYFLDDVVDRFHHNRFLPDVDLSDIFQAMGFSASEFEHWTTGNLDEIPIEARIKKFEVRV